MEQGDTLDKRFYKIRDVAELLDIPQPTLRFWEKEFPALKPRRNDGGTRFYTPADIELLRQIKFLVRDKGMKLAAARDTLSSRGDDVSRRVATLQRLRQIRDTLVSLQEALSLRNTQHGQADY